MAGEREQVTRTDVAEAVRAMASFPWQEMLDVQLETAQALREIREDRAGPAGDGAADVGPVREVDRERDNGPADEHRPNGLHVGQVVAANLRKIEEPHVAGSEAGLRHALEELLQIVDAGRGVKPPRRPADAPTRMLAHRFVLSHFAHQTLS